MKIVSRGNNTAGVRTGMIIIALLFVICSSSIAPLYEMQPSITIKNIDSTTPINFLDNLESSSTGVECFVNTIEGFAFLCDDTPAAGVIVTLRGSGAAKTSTVLPNGYWQFDVGTLTGGNWTVDSPFTVTFSGIIDGINWTGNNSGTVSQPSTCLYDCGSTHLTPLNGFLASANSSSTTVKEGDTISFTGSTCGGDPPYSWSWNFGDGTSSTNQDPTHKYTRSGTYAVSLQVTDDAERTHATTLSVVVSSANQSSEGVNNSTEPKTPGFEFIIILSALALVFLWKRKSKK
jgi:hypothetical protein